LILQNISIQFIKKVHILKFQNTNIQIFKITFFMYRAINECASYYSKL